MDLAEFDLEALYPGIPWREPIAVSNGWSSTEWACRICIGTYGLRGTDIDRLPQTQDEFEKHMVEFHP